jgi:hypothetical protein
MISANHSSGCIVIAKDAGQCQTDQSSRERRWPLRLAIDQKPAGRKRNTCIVYFLRSLPGLATVVLIGPPGANAGKFTVRELAENFTLWPG